MSQHQQGAVRLNDVDDPTSPDAVVVLNDDPAVVPAEAEKLESFCLACHDADAAAGLAPFSDGLVPPVIDASAWSAASHNLGGASGAMTCYGDGETFGCHGSGHGSNKNSLLAPPEANQAPIPGDALREEEGMCYTCHDADGPAAIDILTEFQSTNHHNVSSLDQGDGSRIECVSCHNPHLASASVPLADPDTGSSVQWAGTGVDFCLVCHDGTPPAGVSFPATSPGTGYDKSNYPGTTHATELTSDSCRQCHAEHGSDNFAMLHGQYVIADGNRYNVGEPDYDVCWMCHNESGIIELQNAFENLHNKHVRGTNAPCITCHNAHGPFDPGEEGLFSFQFAVEHGYDIQHIDGHDNSTSFWIEAGSNTGNCYITCHRKRHAPRSYSRENALVNTASGRPVLSTSEYWHHYR